MSIAKMCSVADQLNKRKPGYSQDAKRRWRFLDRVNRSLAQGALDCDCSSSCGGIAWLGGYNVDLTGTFYTGNFKQKLVAAGFKAVNVSKVRNLNTLERIAVKGSFVLGEGHVVFVRGTNQWWSAEYNELGKALGGKPGNQGDKVGYRKPYMRSAGWDWVLVPPVEAKPKPRYRYPVITKSNKPSVEAGLFQQKAKRRHPVLARKAARMHGAKRFVVDKVPGDITMELVKLIKKRYNRKPTARIGHWMWRHLGLAKRVRKVV